ncbi:MAG TPA: proton-conducting transporter membrane subunit [Intrasporangium sp.]|uniref:NADH-quinone oxidoreductase subunit 5 family protein n=1 Tax=Intrasporangium sp. TaxID=1925024 RepID=UPI002D7953B1|nr:proton-conducting transporter membrane subunit [Intrasporangium sp.]HET7398799.1 proton-conducting transporter membrane subunit [Intrasporangium sp.]
MRAVVPLLVAVPALAALAGLLVRLLGSRSGPAARVVAVAGAAVTAALALLQWLAPAAAADLDSLGGLPLGDLSVPLHLLSDPLSGLLALVVALVVLGIQLFTTWYLTTDPRYPQFAATVSLFAAGMLLVVQSADLALTLVGWEVMGWCSWLLIGHDSERAAARRAAYKAFLVTRAADIGMVVGLVALAVRARSTDLQDVLTAPGADATLTAGLVCVALGVAGKSGLVPFHDWLPDAMEGPTPASALIHAATMVAAGSYVVGRLFPLYAVSDGARTLLAVLAAATMVWAALLAFAQSDLKRLLAYSTLSQIAILLGGLAAAPVAAGAAPAMGHLVGHAFFKALLFLAAGWLAVLAGATALPRLRGRLRGTGALRWAVGIGLAALAGVPPLIGFVTKDTVVDAALEGLHEGGGVRAGLVVVALYATIALTAAYCMRVWLVLTAAAPAPEPGAVAEAVALEAGGEPHAIVHPPITLAAALVVALLAGLTALGTVLLLSVPGTVSVGVATAAVSVVVVAASATAVFVVSETGDRDAAELLPGRVRSGAERGFGADTAYVAVGGAVTRLARLVVMLDRDVVDAYPRAAVVATRAVGRVGDRVHRGVPSAALLALLAGVVVVAVLGVAGWR